MSTEKSIPILAPPAYTPTNQPYYQQPIPQANFVPTAYHNQGFADPESAYHEAEKTTNSVIVAKKTVPTKVKKTKGYSTGNLIKAIAGCVSSLIALVLIVTAVLSATLK